MKLNLYEDKNIKEEKVDIHFTNMRPVIKQLIDTVKSERPTLSGRPADADLDDGEEIILDAKEIYYLDHVDRKLFAYTKDGVFRIMNTLANCEEMLWNYGFVRVSKSNLINIYKIKQLKPDANMKVYTSFDNGDRICINRSYNKSFKEYLQRIMSFLPVPPVHGLLNEHAHEDNACGDGDQQVQIVAQLCLERGFLYPVVDAQGQVQQRYPGKNDDPRLRSVRGAEIRVVKDAVSRDHGHRQQQSHHQHGFPGKGQELQLAQTQPARQVDRQRGIASGKCLASGHLLPFIVFARFAAHLANDQRDDRHQHQPNDKSRYPCNIHSFYPPQSIPAIHFQPPNVLYHKPDILSRIYYIISYIFYLMSRAFYLTKRSFSGFFA